MRAHTLKTSCNSTIRHLEFRFRLKYSMPCFNNFFFIKSSLQFSFSFLKSNCCTKSCCDNTKTKKGLSGLERISRYILPLRFVAQARVCLWVRLRSCPACLTIRLSPCQVGQLQLAWKWKRRNCSRGLCLQSIRALKGSCDCAHGPC